MGNNEYKAMMYEYFMPDMLIFIKILRTVKTNHDFGFLILKFVIFVLDNFNEKSQFWKYAKIIKTNNYAQLREKQKNPKWWIIKSG